MSRSTRHSPYHGFCADSDKWSKTNANRRLRRAVDQAIYHGRDILPTLREVANVWSFAKDGRSRIDDPTGTGARWMRK